jgi:hypothetical protein
MSWWAVALNLAMILPTLRPSYDIDKAEDLVAFTSRELPLRVPPIALVL